MRGIPFLGPNQDRSVGVRRKRPRRRNHGSHPVRPRHTLSLWRRESRPEGFFDLEEGPFETVNLADKWIQETGDMGAAARDSLDRIKDVGWWMLNSPRKRKGNSKRRNDLMVGQAGSNRWVFHGCGPLVIGLLCALIIVKPDLRAQVYTGSIRGTVADGSGAVIPSTKITLENLDTGFTTTTISNDVGGYLFTPVSVGRYRVRAEIPGFQAVVHENLDVHIDQQLMVDFTLQPGNVAETVEVTAAPSLLQADSASVGQVIQTREIQNLPLNGRNYTFLAQLSAGVTAVQTSNGRGLEGNGMFAANGTRGSEQNYMLNGVDNNNTEPDFVSGTAYAVLPPPDALQEFRMETNNYRAELGRAAGAVLNATLKSGTNQFHGDAWEFVRNDSFDAADFFANATNVGKSEFRRNQFGFTLGGPVTIPKVYHGKDRTFFFVDYEGVRIRQGTNFLTTVPTAAQRSSGFTNFSDDLAGQPGSTPADALGRKFSTGQIFDPATTRAVTGGQMDPVTGLAAVSTGYVRDPFPGNILPAGRIDPNAVKLLNLYPLPNLPGIINDLAGSPVATTTSDSVDVRLDQNFTMHDQLFVSFSNNHLTSLTPPPLPGIANGGNTFNTPRYLTASMGVLSETHTFSPRIVNQFSAGYTRIANSNIPQDANTMGIPAQYGIQGVPQTYQNGGLPTITIGGLNGLGVSGVLPTYKNGEEWDVRENFTIIRGSHAIKGGLEIIDNFIPYLIPPSSRGTFTFSGLYTSIPSNNVATVGPGIAQFLLVPGPTSVAGGINDVGGANSMSASDAVRTVAVRHYYAGYAQDDWKISRKFTLNLGLRYDYFSPILNRYDAQSNFQPNPGSAEWLFPSSRQGNPPLSAAFLATMQKNGVNVAYVSNPNGDAPRINLAPRVGFAWQAAPRLVIRSGYGIFYNDFENSAGGDHYGADNYPYLFSYSFSAPDPAHPLTPNNSIGLLENGLLNVPLTPGSVTGVGLGPIGRQYSYKLPYAQGANVTVQYQLNQNHSLQVGYVGTFSRHIPVTTPANEPSQILPPSVNYLLYIPYPDLSPGFNYITYNGSSQYNSLQATLERRFSAGLSFLGNYTFSKCRGDAQDQLLYHYGGFRAPALPGFGIQGDYAPCEYDVRHVVHFSGIYRLPFGKGGKFLQNTGKLGNAIIGGWTANWILTLEDGFPLNIPCTVGTNAGMKCNALIIPGQDPISGQHNVNQWLNPQAFSNPPAATSIGQSGFATLGGSFGQVVGPGFHRLDMSLFKAFKPSEATTVELRVEVFNLTNTPNFSNTMTTNFASPAFGRITATRDNPNDPREIQLALKFYW
jgi:hypothetical protein